VKPATPAKPATQAAAAKPQAAPAAQGKASPARSQPRQTAAAPAATAAGASTAGSAADGSTASGSTAAVGQTIPTLPGTSGSAAGGTSPTAAGSPASYGRLREIYARQGDELQIGLDGMGFLFLGFPDRPGQADGMAFKSKENRSSKTWFTFQALKMGNYDLDFLQQNNTSGTTAKETVRVHVVSDQDFAAATAQQPDSTNASSSTAEPGDPWFAARLAGAGAYEAAIAELLKGYKDGNAPLNDQIAGLYMKMKTYDAAAKYYAKNLSPSNPSTPSAVLGLTRIAIVQKDQPGLLSRLKQFLAVDDPSAEETLIQAIRLEKDQSQIGVGLDLAAAYAQRYPGGKWLDEADFLTAQFLEADSQFRDIARARDIYQQLVTTYPESAFAEASRQRLLYINRHFFQVR
jgi:outer membrane protein assembly factor BamD (BamD/ComL family)